MAEVVQSLPWHKTLRLGLMDMVSDSFWLGSTESNVLKALSLACS
ncbi:hypothetical protein SNOG_01748 [Parastagonospora nodorum SN15]|uniref:Uncharacterized protein n=1 Tax=Phaeosphaeria nodorum (strain SN15 / ATCC MYA-4574 / FGSC 10173) TaxID=321614 RepID=Q0V2L6_PHANO|nr:hypothetical protein SNOG_01748 [Parastagonospora nodorum SN15]EAT91397.1 hypothetical protein SNOG_01748 [Parastagonospora nodorum SN15]